ncbi:MAG: hypothetical protein EPN20_06745 [Magnetospirillum sp.]|nr:MAG: hypothetical protein EPN20_06745 [Magnetospirillum sp.]
MGSFKRTRPVTLSHRHPQKGLQLGSGVLGQGADVGDLGAPSLVVGKLLLPLPFLAADHDGGAGDLLPNRDKGGFVRFSKGNQGGDLIFGQVFQHFHPSTVWMANSTMPTVVCGEAR